jgi:hypothetical protein
MLMLSSIALGTPETRQLGPFTVSFDLNTSTSYKIDMRTPLENSFSNLYSIGLFTDNETWAEIDVIEYNNTTDATLDVHKDLAVMDMKLNGLNVTLVRDRTISGRKGFVVMGDPFTLENASTSQSNVYRALFWLDSNDCDCGPLSAGKTKIDIISRYPRIITDNLLDSVKLERSKSP